MSLISSWLDISNLSSTKKKPCRETAGLYYYSTNSIIAFWHKRSIHVVFALISRIDKYIYMKSTVQVWGRIK